MNYFLKKLHGIRSDFEEIFFFNEYRSLAGANYRTILALVTILFFTFLALGFAIGGIENLDKKMNNPFTNWVNLDVNRSMQNRGSEVRNYYSKLEVADSFNLNSTNGFARFVLYFYDSSYDPYQHKQDTLFRNSWGRTIEPDEVLLNSILEPKNLVWQTRDTSNGMQGCHIIVTSSLLNLTKFDVPGQGDSTFYLPIKNENSLMFLEVYAVVKELPGLGNRFACLPKLHNIINAIRIDGKTCYSMVVDNNSSSSSYLLLTDKSENIAQIENLAQMFFQNSPFTGSEHVYPRQQGAFHGLRLSFPPAGSPSIDSTKLFIEHARKSVRLSEYAYLDCGSDLCEYLDGLDYNYLAFHFDDLEKIRLFKQDLNDRFDIEMDMSQVESKENFWLVSRLTFVISLILLAFGILSIVLYVNSILKNHLFGIRSNLGTFQAFGLNNSFLTQTYLKIIFSFLVLSILVSYLLATAVDRVEHAIRAEDSLFNIFSPWVLVAIVALILVSLVLAVTTIRRILSDTPGNLIYER